MLKEILTYTSIKSNIKPLDSGTAVPQCTLHKQCEHQLRNITYTSNSIKYLFQYCNSKLPVNRTPPSTVILSANPAADYGNVILHEEPSPPHSRHETAGGNHLNTMQISVPNKYVFAAKNEWFASSVNNYRKREW